MDDLPAEGRAQLHAWTDRGRRVKLYRAVHGVNNLGVVLDRAEAVRSLESHVYDAYRFDADDVQRIPDREIEDRTYVMYRQGFMKNVVNVQATSHFNYMYPLKEDVQAEFQALSDGERLGPIITRLNHQIYNEPSHKTRGKDGLFDIGKGRMSGATFSQTMLNPDMRRRGAKLTRGLVTDPPIEDFEAKVMSTGEYIGLRFEPTIQVNMGNMPEGTRRGE